MLYYNNTCIMFLYSSYINNKKCGLKVNLNVCIIKHVVEANAQMCFKGKQKVFIWGYTPKNLYKLTFWSKNLQNHASGLVN